jgi:hypothetical protein
MLRNTVFAFFQIETYVATVLRNALFAFFQIETHVATVRRRDGDAQESIVEPLTAKCKVTAVPRRRSLQTKIFKILHIPIFGGSATPRASPPTYLALNFFPIILFLSTTLSTGMTGISLHMQWTLTSQ